MSDSDAATPDTAQDASLPATATERSRGPSWWMLILAIALVGGAYGVFLLANSWMESSERSSIGLKEGAPTGWNGFEIGMTRGEIAQAIVDAAVRWPSIQKPGMAPTEWASHVNVTLPGHPDSTFSLRFADGQRWDYGRHPASSDELVDSESLIGGLDSESKLIGIKWMIEKSEFDEAHETVPIDVLRGLGQSHSDRQDVTGHGRVYEWDWPGFKAFYTTIDGLLSLESRPNGVE